MTESQVEGLRQTVKKTSRNPHRDSTMILVAYRHGLRVGEVTDLRWEDVHLDRAEIYVRRLKSSKSTMHSISLSPAVSGGCTGTSPAALANVINAAPSLVIRPM